MMLENPPANEDDMVMVTRYESDGLSSASENAIRLMAGRGATFILIPLPYESFTTIPDNALVCSSINVFPPPPVSDFNVEPPAVVWHPEFDFSSKTPDDVLVWSGKTSLRSFIDNVRRKKRVGAARLSESQAANLGIPAHRFQSNVQNDFAPAGPYISRMLEPGVYVVWGPPRTQKTTAMRKIQALYSEVGAEVEIFDVDDDEHAVKYAAYREIEKEFRLHPSYRTMLNASVAFHKLLKDRFDDIEPTSVVLVPIIIPPAAQLPRGIVYTRLPYINRGEPRPDPLRPESQELYQFLGNLKPVFQGLPLVWEGSPHVLYE
jgi:hypothetical protein